MGYDVGYQLVTSCGYGRLMAGGFWTGTCNLTISMFGATTTKLEIPVGYDDTGACLELCPPFLLQGLIICLALLLCPTYS